VGQGNGGGEKKSIEKKKAWDRRGEAPGRFSITTLFKTDNKKKMANSRRKIKTTISMEAQRRGRAGRWRGSGQKIRKKGKTKKRKAGRDAKREEMLIGEKMTK